MSIVLAIIAAVAVAPPAPTRWVEDHAGLLSPAMRSTLDARLEAYERATAHQVIVWIGASHGNVPLADWAAHTFAAWQLGRKGHDDGVAIFVFAEDREIDIEVGYGLEDKLPDAIASRIIREVMAPRLRSGDRDGAVTAGADAVLAAIEGRPWTGSQAPATSEDDLPSWLSILLGSMLALAAIVLIAKHPRWAFWMLAAILSDRRGGPGGLGGGGGRGGFSGGGGRSGGGGARGGW
jgi:uncharacterized protein